jgi:hypothetical protein
VFLGIISVMTALNTTSAGATADNFDVSSTGGTNCDETEVIVTITNNTGAPVEGVFAVGGLGNLTVFPVGVSQRPPVALPTNGTPVNIVVSALGGTQFNQTFAYESCEQPTPSVSLSVNSFAACDSDITGTVGYDEATIGSNVDEVQVNVYIWEEGTDKGFPSYLGSDAPQAFSSDQLGLSFSAGDVVNIQGSIFEVRSGSPLEYFSSVKQVTIPEDCPPTTTAPPVTTTPPTTEPPVTTVPPTTAPPVTTVAPNPTTTVATGVPPTKPPTQPPAPPTVPQLPDTFDVNDVKQFAAGQFWSGIALLVFGLIILASTFGRRRTTDSVR